MNISRLSSAGKAIYPVGMLAWLAIASMLLWLSGCATTPKDTAGSAIKTIVLDPLAPEHITPATDFNMLGRISIQDRNQRTSGTFRWQHLVSSDEILLFTPLGQAVAEITRDSEGVRLITSSLEAYYADNTGDLTQEILGWRLPLEGLQYWIQGTHSPLTRAEKVLDNQNNVIAIRQDGWEVTFNPAVASSPGLRPKALALTHDYLRIKLVIDDWKVE